MVIQNQCSQITQSSHKRLEQDQNAGTLQEHRIEVNIQESDLQATLQRKEVIPLKQPFLLF